MDRMREEFEVWFWDYHHKDCSMDYWSVIFAIGCYGKYQGIACEGAWQGWKASRAALCVELPSKINDDNDARSYGYDSAITDVEMALEKTGVSYK